MKNYQKEYKEKLDKAKTLHNLAVETNHDNTRMALEELFPELKESEEERIRENLREFLLDAPSQDIVSHHLDLDETLNWLEKQKVTLVPKFRVGDVIGHKDADDSYKIVDIKNGYYVCEKKHMWSIQSQDAFVLKVQQNLVEWSKEDEERLVKIGACLNAYGNISTDERAREIFQLADWLKSLKPKHLPVLSKDALYQAKKDAYNTALDKIEYHSGEPTFDDGWNAAIDCITHLPAKALQ